MLIGEPYLDHYSYFTEGGFDSFVKKGKKAKSAGGKNRPVRNLVRRVKQNVVQKKNNVTQRLVQKKQNIVNNFGMMRRNRFATIQNDPAVQDDVLPDDNTSSVDDGGQMDAPQVMPDASSGDDGQSNDQGEDSGGSDEQTYDFFLQRRWRPRKAKKKISPVLGSDSKKNENITSQNTGNVDTTSQGVSANSGAKTDPANADQSAAANSIAADKKPGAPSNPGQPGAAPKTEGNPQEKEKTDAKPDDGQPKADVAKKTDSTIGLVLGFGFVALTGAIAIYAVVSASSSKKSITALQGVQH